MNDTFTADQVRAVLGEDALTKLTTPTTWVPKYVTGTWLLEHAIPGVLAWNEDRDRKWLVEDPITGEWRWEADVYRPREDLFYWYRIETWPGAEIRDIAPDGPQPIEADVEPGTDEPELPTPYLGQIVTTVEELNALPDGTRIGGDLEVTFVKEDGAWRELPNGWMNASSALFRLRKTAVVTDLPRSAE